MLLKTTTLLQHINLQLELAELPQINCSDYYTALD